MGNQLYREYAQIANEEGYSDIGALFNGVANIDLNHGLQLQNYYNDVIRDQVFCKDEENLWICMQCGNILSGFCAPERCPISAFPKASIVYTVRILYNQIRAGLISTYDNFFM